MALPAFAAERRAAGRRRYQSVSRQIPLDHMVLPAGRSATNPLHATVAVERRDRDGQTNGRTPDRS